jgi:hypothetical protein
MSGSSPLQNPQPTSFRLIVAACMIALCMVTTGCVRRRLTVRTNPPGAQVFVDDLFLDLERQLVPHRLRSIRGVQQEHAARLREAGFADGYRGLTLRS